MYIRVMRGRFSPANTDEAVRIARDQLLPTLQQRPGFRTYQAGLNHDAGTLIAISAWDTREQAQEAQTAHGPLEALGIRLEAPEISRLPSRHSRSRRAPCRSGWTWRCRRERSEIEVVERGPYGTVELLLRAADPCPDGARVVSYHVAEHRLSRSSRAVRRAVPPFDEGRSPSRLTGRDVGDVSPDRSASRSDLPSTPPSQHTVHARFGPGRCPTSPSGSRSRWSSPCTRGWTTRSPDRGLGG